MRSRTRGLFTLLLVLATSLILLPAPRSAAQSTSTSDFLIDAAALMRTLSDPNVIVVDMRRPDTFGGEVIAGAVGLNVFDLAQPDTSDEAIGPWEAKVMGLLGGAGISPRNTVVAYDENGNLFATRMRWLLKYLGHDRALVLDGGLAAWKAAGGAVAPEPSTRPAATYQGTPRPERLASWKYVLDRLGNPNVQIIDVRSADIYRGDTPQPNIARAGHIPTALNLDWSNNVQADAPRTFKSLAELQALYDTLGLRRDREIIVYCTTGIQSSNTLFVLDMLGYPKVRLYSGSWAEWGNREDLPMAAGAEPGRAPGA